MGDATTIDLAAWERDFRINVTSMVLMSRFAIPEMRKVGKGSIVNMSSVSGRKFFSSNLSSLHHHRHLNIYSPRRQPKSSVPYQQRSYYSNDKSNGCTTWP